MSQLSTSVAPWSMHVDEQRLGGIKTARVFVRPARRPDARPAVLSPTAAPSDTVEATSSPRLRGTGSVKAAKDAVKTMTVEG